MTISLIIASDNDVLFDHGCAIIVTSNILFNSS